MSGFSCSPRYATYSESGVKLPIIAGQWIQGNGEIVTWFIKYESIHFFVHCGFQIFRNMTSNGFKLPFYVKNDFLKSETHFGILSMYYYNYELLYKIISGCCFSFPVTDVTSGWLKSSAFASSSNFDSWYFLEWSF